MIRIVISTWLEEMICGCGCLCEWSRGRRERGAEPGASKASLLPAKTRLRDIWTSSKHGNKGIHSQQINGIILRPSVLPSHTPNTCPVTDWPSLSYSSRNHCRPELWNGPSLRIQRSFFQDAPWPRVATLRLAWLPTTVRMPNASKACTQLQFFSWSFHKRTIGSLADHPISSCSFHTRTFPASPAPVRTPWRVLRYSPWAAFYPGAPNTTKGIERAGSNPGWKMEPMVKVHPSQLPVSQGSTGGDSEDDLPECMTWAYKRLQRDPGTHTILSIAKAWHKSELFDCRLPRESISTSRIGADEHQEAKATRIRERTTLGCWE